MNITTRTFKKVVGTVINYFCGEKLTLVKILSKKQKIYEQSMEKEWRKTKFTSFAFNPSLDTAISSLRACSSFSDFFRNYLHHTFKFIFSHLYFSNRFSHIFHIFITCLLHSHRAYIHCHWSIGPEQ